MNKMEELLRHLLMIRLTLRYYSPSSLRIMKQHLTLLRTVLQFPIQTMKTQHLSLVPKLRSSTPMKLQSVSSSFKEQHKLTKLPKLIP